MKGLSLRKKLLFVLLAVMLLTATLYTTSPDIKSVKAAENDFIFSNGVILGYTGSSTIVSIPETIGGQAVTTINGAFTFNTDITEVIIPEGVTTITGAAFHGCSSLQIMIIPASVTTIAPGAISYCQNLSALIIDPLNTSFILVDNMLYNADQTEIVQYVCSSTGDTFTIPNTVTTVYDFAFAASQNLRDITIPDTVTSIGEGAFASCPNLTNLIVDANNPAYTAPGNILLTKDETTLLTYPGNISGSVYTIPTSVTTLAPYSFSGCVNLLTVNVGDLVQEMTDAFLLCQSITEIIVTEGNSNYSSRDGVLTSKDYATLLYYPCGKTQSQYIVPESITTIGETAFYSHPYISEIILTENVTYIDDLAFVGCKVLTKLYVPNTATEFGSMVLYAADNVKIWGYPGSTAEAYALFWELPFVALGSASEWTYIDNGDGTCNITDYEGTATVVRVPSVINNLLVHTIAFTTFDSCASIEYIYFYEGTNTIEATDGAGSAYIFDDCLSLREIYLPASLEKFQTYTDPYKPFRGCISLVNIFVHEDNVDFYDVDGVLFSWSKTLLAYPNGKTAESYNIPSGTTGISYAAFENPHLLTVSIPGTVTTLSKGDEPTFKNNISTVYIEYGVETVGDVFSETMAMDIYFPDSVNTLSGFDYGSVPHTFYVYEDSDAHIFAVANSIHFVFLCMVEFDAMGGDAIDNQIVTANTAASEPRNVTMDNHILMGWFTDDEFTTQWNFSTPVTYSMRLYAKWEEGYSIIYHMNGGSNNVSNPSYYLANTEVSFASPTRTNYRFDGWYTDSSCALEYKIEKIAVEDTGVVEVWADWWAEEPEPEPTSGNNAPLSDERKPEITYTSFPREISYMAEDQTITVKGTIGIKYAHVNDISVSYSGNIDKLYKYESGKDRLTTYAYSHTFSVDEVQTAANDAYTISIRLSTAVYYEHTIPIDSYNLVTEVLHSPDHNIYMDSEKTYEIRTMSVSDTTFSIVGATYENLTPEICQITAGNMVVPLAAGTAQIKTKIQLDYSNSIEYVTEYEIIKMTTSEPSTLERELMCHCYGEYCTGLPEGGIDPALLELIEKIRSESDVPIYIVSGYRCSDYNRNTGGEEGSEHVKGTAADLWSPDMSVEELYELCDLLNPNGGVGLYPDYVHIDVRNAYIRWDEE